MDLGLTGKIAMVSGASKGLGLAVARALALEGANVAMASEHRSDIEDAARRVAAETGASVLGVPCDVRSSEAVTSWHQATVQRFGGVDLLFTNSGGPPMGPALAFDDQAWRASFELLVLGVVRLVRLVVPSMEMRGGGSILMNTSSSVKDPIPNLALSNVLRASVAALSKTLASELAPKGIRVNHIMPGRIATARMRALDQFNARTQGISVQEAEAQTVRAVPMARYGTPEEFGRVAAFLLSDASAYVTGTTQAVDGGLIRSVL